MKTKPKPKPTKALARELLEAYKQWHSSCLIQTIDVPEGQDEYQARMQYRATNKSLEAYMDKVLAKFKLATGRKLDGLLDSLHYATYLTEGDTKHGN